MAELVPIPILVMLSGSAVKTALESKHPGATRSCYGRAMFFDHEDRDRIAENALIAAVTPSTAGSFDYVRLSPHSAQDDNLEESVWLEGYLNHRGHRAQRTSLP